jgi:hypothetical protein
MQTNIRCIPILKRESFTKIKPVGYLKGKAAVIVE